MTRKCLTMMAAVALLVGLAISAKAQGDPTYSLTLYDNYAGAPPTDTSNGWLGTASYFAQVQVAQGTGSQSNDVIITLTAGGGDNDWDLSTDPNGNVFYFNVSGVSGFSCNDVSVTGGSLDGGTFHSSDYGCATSQTPDTLGTWSYAITGPSNGNGSDEIESMTILLDTSLTTSNVGTTFAAYVSDWPGDGDDQCPSSNSPCGWAYNTSSTVPEPGTLSLLGTGLFGLAGILRRKLSA